MELVGLVLLVTKASAGQSHSSRFVRQEVAALNNMFSTRIDSVEMASDQQIRSIDMLSIQHIDDILTQIVDIAKKNPNAQAPEKEVLLLLWDCGGQSVFLDILPAFFTPRTMFFCFYDARRIADSCIICSFYNDKMIDYQVQRVTTVEVLLEWMASIHAMLVPVIPEKAEELVPKFPLIIPIGTHGDDSDVNKEEVIHQLNAEYEGKAFIPLLKESLIVDNTTAGQGENEDPAFHFIRDHKVVLILHSYITGLAWIAHTAWFSHKEYQRALELGEVHSAYVRVMFVGPGGVGKSSLLCGLMNKPLEAANSTQLVDTVTVKPDTVPVRCSPMPISQPDPKTMIKPVTQQWAKISDSHNSKPFWRKTEDQDEVMEIVGCLNVVIKNQEHADTTSTTSNLESVDTQSIILEDPSKFQQMVDNFLKVAKQYPDVQPPEKEVLINVWDCGGQPVFLDVLPTFLTRRTVFILVYDASRNLTDKCLIRIFKDGEVIDSEEHRATTLELLLEWMASIHAILQSIPRIICVGTHGDKVVDSQAQIIDRLKLECKGKAFNHLLNSNTIVNNTKAGHGENEDPEFNKIRTEIQEFAMEEFTTEDLRVRTPVAWVLFRRIFQKNAKESEAAIVPLQEVNDIARVCKIPTEQISTMIKFYHDLAVFFHYSEVPGLQDYVIADPQWLISQFAKILALPGFEKFPNDDLWMNLREKGILVEKLYNKLWNDKNYSKIKPQFLMDLLVHFLLAAPINEASKVTSADGKEYFISCILPASNLEDKRTRDVKVAIKRAAPLYLVFNTHYVPPGFFPRLVTTLVNSGRFRVSKVDRVYRDRITMSYSNIYCDIDEVTLTKCRSSVRIEIIRKTHRTSLHLPFSIVCREILDFITDSFPKILLWLRGIKIDHAFICNSCPKKVNTEEQHFIRIPRAFTIEIVTALHCDNKKNVDLTLHHRYWLKCPQDSNSNTPCLSETELQQVGHIIQSQGKIEDLAESLEMRVDQTLLDDPHAGYEILKAWSEEMWQYTSTLRVHLSHHLVTLGITDVANRLLRNRPLVHVPNIQQQEDADNLSGTLLKRLNQVLDSQNSGVQKDLGKIADFAYEWEGKVAEELGLTKSDVNNIKERCKGELHLQVREALTKWVALQGDKATYQNLITAFKKADHHDYADFVRHIIISESTTQTVHKGMQVQQNQGSSLQLPSPTTAPSQLSPQEEETNFNSGQQLQLEGQESKSTLPHKVSHYFSEEMSIIQLSQWLSSHPKIGTDYQADIGILKDAKINGYGFLDLDTDCLKELRVSVGFRLAVMKIIKTLPKEVAL